MRFFQRCVIAFFILASSLTLAETRRETIDFTSNSRPLVVSSQIRAAGVSEQLAVTGAPAVPMIVRQFTYPIGSRLLSARIDGIETNQMRLDRPLPNLPPKPIVSGVAYTQQPPLLVKPGVLYPNNWYSLETRGGLDTETLMPILSVTVRIYPVRVNEQSAEYLEKMTLKLDIDRVDAEENRDTTAMLIIAPQAYLDVMGPFITHKTSLGLTTITRSVEDIEENGTAGFDLQERIKKAIHEAYTSSSIRYLLLVGDASNIPIRYTFHMDFGGQNGWTHTPSDLYYADLLDAHGEFSSWDSDQDGLYGEFEGNNSDDCDLLPDVLFGRIPAQSVTELEGVMNKLIAYESLSGTEDWLDRIVLLGADTFNAEEHNEHSGVPEGEALCERLNTDHLNAFPTTRLYQTQTYPRDGELTAPAITAAINQGAGILNYANHGNINIWGWGGRTYSTTNVEALANQEKLPVVFSFACLTAAFDTENPESPGYGIVDRSLGEAFVLKSSGGAVAFFGATRSAFGGGFGYGDHLGAMGYLDWQYFKKIGEGQTAQGRLYLETLTELLTHIGVTGTEEFITAIEYIYFGDPSLTIPGTPVGPNFDLRFRSIDDSPAGNDNGCAEPGETVELVCDLSNDGTAASDVTVVLTIPDDEVTIINGSVEIASAPRGYQSRLDPGFRISIASDAAMHSVNGSVSVTAGSQRSTFPVQFNIGLSAFLTASAIFVRADPNNDNFANPGESIQFSPDFHNIGCIDASLFTADVQIDDPYVLDYGVCSDGSLPTIEPGHSATPGGIFWAELDPVTPHQHAIDCLIEINGPHGFHNTINLPLVVNDCTMPVLSQFEVIPAAPNPGDTITVTVHAVDGNGVDSVNANFLSYGSQSIWGVTMLDDGLHGDGNEQDGVYGCSLTLPDTLIYYRVDIEARDGEGFSGQRTGIGGVSTIAFESDDSILIVSGAEDDLYLGLYAQALNDAGYRYDVWSYLRGVPTQDILNRYIDGAVIWYIAHEYPMLQEPERAVIETYINAGGKLLITEQDIGWALVEKGTSESMRWYHDVLKAAYIFDGVEQRVIDGIASDPVSDGLTFSIEAGSGAQNQDYPSLIAPVDDATACFLYRSYPGPEAGVAAVKADHNGGGKHVYLAFGFEGIASQESRRDVMDSIMGWFGMDKTGRSCPWNQSPGWWIGPETQSANVHTYSLYCPADRLVYTIGGVSVTNVLDRSIYYTDPETMASGDTGVDLETPRILHAQACLHDGTGYKIYIAGGMDTEIPIYSVEMFDPITRTIETLTLDPMPADCAGIPGTYVAADNKLYVIGAWQWLTFLTGTTWQFDPLAPAGQRWTTVPATLSIPRYSGAAAALDGKLYVIGGYSAEDDGTGNITEYLHQTVEVLDLTNPGAGWNDAAVADIPEPLIFGGAYGVPSGANAMLAGSIVVSRGWPIGGHDLTYLYHPETDTWEEFYATQETRLNRGPLVYVPTSRGPELWLVGGHYQSIYENIEILRLGMNPNGPYIGIRTNGNGISEGIPLRIELDIHGSPSASPIDCYIALEAYGSYYFLTSSPTFPSFSSSPEPLFSNTPLPGDFGYSGPIMEIPLPNDIGSLKGCFYAATIRSGTGQLEGGLTWADFRAL